VRSIFVEYRERAAECLSLIRRTDDPVVKALYVKLAQSWVTLADQVEARALHRAAADAALMGEDTAGEIA
jgi:hypothetical protein